MTLYDLTEQYGEIFRLYEAGEIDADVMLDTIEGINGEIDDKINATCIVIKNKRADIGIVEAEIKRLTERYKTMVSDVDRMSTRLGNMMRRVGRERYETPIHRVRFNKGERVVYTDEDAVIEYMLEHHPEAVTEVRDFKISKTDIKRLIKNGEAVPYTEFITTMNIDID